MICSANQWTDFYMIDSFVMKELSFNSSKLEAKAKGFLTFLEGYRNATLD